VLGKEKPNAFSYLGSWAWKDGFVPKHIFFLHKFSTNPEAGGRVADKGSEDRKDIHKGFLSAIIDVKSDVPVALSSHTSPIYGLP
jgi:hypothetical protein